MLNPFAFLRLNVGIIFLVACLLSAAGCAPRFKYRPHHDAAYASAARTGGVQIERDETERVARSDEAVEWSKPDSQIVANALADELKYARLFRPVKVVMVTDPSRQNDKYSRLIRFRIRKFQLRPDENFAERIGRKALKYQGLQGYFISKGIPRKWIVEVEIEFQLFDARSGERIFAKTYLATPRRFSTNGYSSRKEERQFMSDALEEVVKAFVADVADRSEREGRR